MEGRMKGQLFIIAAVLVIISLVMIRDLVNIFAAEDVPLVTLDREINNINDEYRYLLYSLQINFDTNKIDTTLKNFSNFLRKHQDSEILYFIVYRSQGSPKNYYVYIGNFLGERINATINAKLDSNHTTTAMIQDKTSFIYNFSESSIKPLNMTLTYIFRDTSWKENFTVVSSSKSTLAGLFDMTIKKDNNFMRTQNIYTVIWDDL